MSSETINIIGLGKYSHEQGGRRVYHAMNKTEMLQEKVKAERDDGETISFWYAQTKAGQRILNAFEPYQGVPDSEIKHVKLVECPICQGQGRKRLENGPGLPMYRGCVVCNSSGLTRSGHWKKWQDWQLEEMRKEFQ